MRRLVGALAIAALYADGAHGAGVDVESADGVLIPAKLLEKEISNFPPTERRAGREGWVRMSFCVGTDGAVRNPIVVASSGVGAFEREALRTLGTRRYAPATLDGGPVEQCLNGVLLMYRFDSTAKGARTKFVNRWKRVSAAIAAGRLDDASRGISSLEPLNIYESAFLALLWADFARAQGDRPQEIRRLGAVLWFADYIEAQTLASVRRRLFYLQVQEGQYGFALSLFEALEMEKDVLTEDERRTGERLRNAVRGDAILATPLRLRDTVAGEEGASFSAVRVLRSAFGFADVEGEVNRFELRCQAKWYSSPVLTDRTWHVPRKWGECTLFVFGAPEGAVQLREYPDSDAQSSSPAPDAPAASTAATAD